MFLDFNCVSSLHGTFDGTLPIQHGIPGRAIYAVHACVGRRSSIGDSQLGDKFWTTGRLELILTFLHFSSVFEM